MSRNYLGGRAEGREPRGTGKQDVDISTAALVLPWGLGIWEGELGSPGVGQRTVFTAT